MLAHVFDARGGFPLQQRKEQVFFALEIGVERASGVACVSGNFFQLGGLEAVARKDFFRGLQKPGAGKVRSFLVTGGGRCDPSFLWEASSNGY